MISLDKLLSTSPDIVKHYVCSKTVNPVLKLINSLVESDGINKKDRVLVWPVKKSQEELWD